VPAVTLRSRDLERRPSVFAFRAHLSANCVARVFCGIPPNPYVTINCTCRSTSRYCFLSQYPSPPCTHLTHLVTASTVLPRRTIRHILWWLGGVPKGSSRATRKAKRTLVKGVKEAFSRLAVGAAENNSLALAVASVKAELGADGQQDDAPGGEAAENAGAVVLAGALGP